MWNEIEELKSENKELRSEVQVLKLYNNKLQQSEETYREKADKF